MIRRLYIIAAVAALGFACLGYAYFVEPFTLVVRNETVRIAKWDRGLDGFKIVVIGDIHGGSRGVDEAKLRRVVAETNAAEPDIVVLLGDFVAEIAGKVDRNGVPILNMEPETIAASISGIRSRHGVFAVLGNHEVWYGEKKVADALTAVGYRVLQNEVAAIEHNGTRLRILGFKDHLNLKINWKELAADARKLLDDSGKGDVIALEHSPDIMPMITGENIISDDLRLVLAAHTHGGQVRIPLAGRPIVPSTYGQKYAYGHVRENDVDLWVTSGIGMSVLPIRFMVPPEIVVLTLKSGD